MAFCPALLELAVASQGLPKFCTITSSNLHNTWPVQTRSLRTWSKLSFKRLCYSLLRLSQSSISKNWLNASSTRTTWVPLLFLWAPQSRRDLCNKRITNRRDKKKQQVIWAKNQPKRLLLSSKLLRALHLCFYFPVAASWSLTSAFLLKLRKEGLFPVFPTCLPRIYFLCIF